MYAAQRIKRCGTVDKRFVYGVVDKLWAGKGDCGQAVEKRSIVLG